MYGCACVLVRVYVCMCVCACACLCALVCMCVHVCVSKVGGPPRFFESNRRIGGQDGGRIADSEGMNVSWFLSPLFLSHKCPSAQVRGSSEARSARAGAVKMPLCINPWMPHRQPISHTGHIYSHIYHPGSNSNRLVFLRGARITRRRRRFKIESPNRPAIRKNRPCLQITQTRCTVPSRSIW